MLTAFAKSEPRKEPPYEQSKDLRGLSDRKAYGTGNVRTAACHQTGLLRRVYLRHRKNRRPVPDEILEKLPSLLLLSEAETEEMYDLAARSRHTVSADLPEYIMEKDIVRAALRTAKSIM